MGKPMAVQSFNVLIGVLAIKLSIFGLKFSRGIRFSDNFPT